MLVLPPQSLSVFFFNDTATTEIYTLSLHDALPICGTPAHAALLGLIVTVTHTVGVFALGLVTLALSQLFVPDRLYPWLNLASGLLVVGIGISVLRARWRHRHAHDHDHEHAHDARSLVA